MGMSNREISALNREARSREEYTQAINSAQGKEYQKERLAWEKAAGGRKRLAEAETVMADAVAEAAEVVRRANVEAGAIRGVANEENTRAEVALSARQKKMDADSAAMIAQKAVVADLETQKRKALDDIAAREAALGATHVALNKRETAVREASEANRTKETELDARAVRMRVAAA